MVYPLIDLAHRGYECNRLVTTAIMQEMEAAFVTALRLWVGLWGVIGVIVGLRRKGEFRWAHTERVIRPQWLGRVFFVVIGVFLIAAALLLKVAPKR